MKVRANFTDIRQRPALNQSGKPTQPLQVAYQKPARAYDRTHKKQPSVQPTAEVSIITPTELAKAIPSRAASHGA
jgi:hypothetical protein